MRQNPTKYYACTDFVEVQGFVACKNWTPIHNQSFVEMLAITPKEMVLIGGSIISVFAIILAFVLIAKASKVL